MDLSDLQAAIQARGYGTDTAAEQLVFINQTYREIHSAMRWPFLEAIDQGNLSTSVGVQNYNFPNTMSNWRNIDAVRISQPNTQNFPRIDYMEPQDLFDKLQDSQPITSTPTNWTMYAQQLWFYPVPDDIYSVSIWYCIEPADLVNPTDVPVIPLAFQDVIVTGAIVKIAHRNRDWIGQELMTTEYTNRINAFMDEYLIKQRQTGTEVERSGWWDTSVNYPLMPTSGFGS